MDGLEHADLVIGDFNYIFDPGVRLSVIDAALSDWVVVVDEAHNLPERAMGYGSPEVLLAHAEAAADLLMESSDFAKVRPFVELAEDTAEWLRAGIEQIPPDARDGEAAFELEEGMERREVFELAGRFDGLSVDYLLLSAVEPLVPRGELDPWQALSRAMLQVRVALERSGEETVALWRRHRRYGRRGGAERQQLSLMGGTPGVVSIDDECTGLRLLCRDPSRLLRPVMEGLDSVICMSATLTPTDFYRQMLGLSEDRLEVLDRPSPFPPENRSVMVVPSVSTQYRHRERDREATAALIQQSLEATPGNLAVFFPSFAFMEAIETHLEFGSRPVLRQQRGMSEASRAELLETLREGAGHVLLAVLGGIFSEGVDLPGDALVGAVIVGPALPQANLSRRLLQQWYQDQYEQGFRYAWLVPGMSRVVQAAGRVVRSAEDRGAVVLVGQRFLQRDYQSFFPDEWVVEKTTQPGNQLRGFWGD
jgi:DNA excision repair protein ERCC-2